VSTELPMRCARQSGATLTTSLLMLLVLTVLGLTGMQMSRMEERMAGNTRDINMAFQGAEAALRNGEALLRKQSTRPLDCPNSPCDSPIPVWTAGVLGEVVNRPPSWWQAGAGNAIPFADAQGQQSMNGQSADPTFFIEHLGFVRTDGGVEMGLDAPSGRDFYQVTAQSSGASGSANIILQSTYARKF